MKRNPILVLGLGVLLSFGVFAVGCGDSGTTTKNDGGGDAKKDTGAGGSVATGGAKGTGGALGTGGATGAGGALATGGALGTGGGLGTGGATGNGGATGADGGLPDGAPDVFVGNDGKLDSQADQPIKNDSNDVGNVKFDGPPALDGVGVDVTPVSLDTAIDQAALDTAALDTASIEVEIDGGVDGSGN